MNQIDWYLRRILTKDVKICVQILRVIGLIRSQWELHTFYLFWSDFHGESQEKPGGGLSTPGKNQNRNQFAFFSFGVNPLNPFTGKVSLKSVRWHVARLPGALVDTLLMLTEERHQLKKGSQVVISEKFTIATCPVKNFRSNLSEVEKFLVVAGH